MKKTIVLLSIAIVVVGVMAGLRVFVSDNDYDVGQSEGEKLAEMETETTRIVKNSLQEIKEGSISQDEFRTQLKDIVEPLLDYFSEQENGKNGYLNAAYNCELIRKLSNILTDKKDYEEVELKLRNDNLTRFSNEAFSYCLDASINTEEEADYIKLSAWAEDIGTNLEQEIARYTRRVFAWYGNK